MCEGHLLNLSAGSNSTQNFISSENIFTFENNLHYGRRTLCRVLGALPSVKTRALGKETVCLMPHSAKPALSKGRLCRVPNTRQMSSLPSVRHSAKNNPQQNTSGDAGGPSVILCRVLAVSTRQTCCLCRVLQAWHSAKRFLCRVPIPSLGKVFLFLFLNFFYGIYTVP